MADQEAFADLVRKVRAGDAAAAEELVRRYEAVVRLEVRCRLTDQRLRRVFDSLDICQAVLGSFFVRAASGQYELDQPAQLRGLLREMARRKLAFEVRRQRAGRRDVRRQEAAEHSGWEGAAAQPTPSRVAVGRDLLDAVRGRLDSEERRLADLRALGREWGDIAAEIGGTPGALRKQLARALDRVARDLQIDEDA
jgi:RNA polymerase sigma-70 factor (ECF subfamily)